MVYDPSQVLTAEQYRSVEEVHNIIQDAGNNMFHLLNQKRIHANKTTVAWIRNLIDNHEIGKLMYDEEYDLQIMDTPEELERLIRKKASDEKKKDCHGLLLHLIGSTKMQKLLKTRPNHIGMWKLVIGKCRGICNYLLLRKIRSTLGLKYQNQLMKLGQPLQFKVQI